MRTAMKRPAARVLCCLLLSWRAACVIGGGTLLAAQNRAPQETAAPPAAPPVIRVNVRQVLVPVVVTDAKGHHVSDLKQSDFIVTEDSVAQEIAAFRVASDTLPAEVAAGTGAQGSAASRERAPGAAAANGGIAGAGAVRRTYLICVDTLHSAFESFARMKDAVNKVLRQEQGADSQYALIALGRELKVVHDSTQDASAIAAAVRGKEFQKMIQQSEAASTAVAVQQFAGLMRSYCSACACEGNGAANSGGELAECSSFKARVQGALLAFGERTYALNQDFLRRLNEVVKATAAMPTTRTVIFISDGFNRFPGQELYSVLQSFSPKDHSFQFNPRDNGPELEAILKMATRHDVKFYTLDSRGLYSATFAAGNTFNASSTFSTNTQMDSRSGQSEATATTESVDRGAGSVARSNTDALAGLARETGGLFFENSNDLAKGVARALADAREYYVLAYVPKNEVLDGKYRKIAVTMKDGEKRYRVTAKAGYWAAAD